MFNLLKKKRKEKSSILHSHVPTRMNILLFIVLICTMALILQLAYLQLVHGQTFKNKISQSTKKIVVESTPRGNIYDSTGRALVTNKGLAAITYTKGPNTTAEKMREVALTLSKLITLPEDKTVTKRDKIDFYLANPKTYEALQHTLPTQQLKDKHGDAIDNATLYQKVVDSVQDSALTFSKEELKAVTLFKRMNAAYALTTVYLKTEEVSDEEIALVAERKKDLPGVGTGMDWKREYPYHDQLKSILGTVSTEQTGLPEELAEKYLALGYAMNDRVGTSFLEEQYEQALQGVKKQNEVELDRNGQIIEQKQRFAGKKGENLLLTVDIAFQQKVDDILKKNYAEFLSSGKGAYSDGVYAVALNPTNGDILAVSGVDHDLETNELTLNPLNALNSVFVPGSVVKGATISAGYLHHVIEGNDVFMDQPIKLAGTSLKSSIFNRAVGNQIPMDVVRALGESSNSYMMQLALKIMGISYSYDMSMPNDPTIFNTLRKVYAQYGLGSDTGLDLPQYSKGLVVPTQQLMEKDGKTFKNGAMGLALDLSYGNYDNYTVMQLAQYISTIATSGKRYAPRFVKGIYSNDENGNLGSASKMIPPKLLNTVSLTNEQWDIIHKGFYATTHAPYGTATTILPKAKYSVAAKTGTAETYYFPGDGTQHAVVNSSLIAYAPFEQPKIAVALVLPHIQDDNSGYNQKITKEILDAYYDLYEK